MELVLVLNGRKVRDHPAEHLVARPICRCIAIGDLLAILRDPQFLGHQPEQQIDVVPLAEEEEELGFLKGGQESLGELFPFDRCDTDGGVLRHAAAEDRHERLAGLSRECRSGAGADTEIECRGDIRDAGEVNRLMLMGAGDVDEQLFGDGIRDRLIIGRHGAIQRDRGEAAGHGQAAEDSR